jgi:hypothetical protein
MVPAGLENGGTRLLCIALMFSKRSTMTEQTWTPWLKNNEEAVEVALISQTRPVLAAGQSRPVPILK